MQSIGDIDERGLIIDIDKRGFSVFQCWCELLANSIDARCKNIEIKINKDNIKLIDDGHGMNFKKLRHMWSLFRQNHSEDY